MDEQNPPVTPDPTAPAGPSVNPAPATPAEPSVDPVTPAEPVAPAPTAAPVTTPAVDTNPERQRKILMVEDDEALAGVYLTRLEAEGFAVKRVQNGEDALAAALEFRPDLILLDVMMPKISGFDVLDILRNTPETANMKIIMLTALSQEADRERAKALAVDDYLVKSQVVVADIIKHIKQRLGM